MASRRRQPAGGPQGCWGMEDEMKQRMTAWKVAGLGLAMATGMAASAAGETNLTAGRIVAEVLRANPELRIYEQALEAARAELKTAGRASVPVLQGEGGRIRSKNLDGSLAGEGAVWTASVQQTFEWPGRLSLRKAIANADVRLAEIGMARFRNALAGRARQLALGMAGEEEKARVAREVSDRFRALREVLVQRDPAGVTPLLEVRILEATELSLRRRAADRELAAGGQRIELNLLRGVAADAPVSVGWSVPGMMEAPGTQALMAAAATNNLGLQSRLAELGQQGLRTRLAKNERWPAIAVAPMYTEENGSTTDRFIKLGVSVPLPLWRGNASNVAAAAAREKQATAALEATRREVELHVLVAAQRYASRRDEMGRWRDDSARAFREAAELADRHYRLGAVPATTYVELQKQYLEAVETLLDTRRDALAAAVELEEATGIRLVREDEAGEAGGGR